MPKTYDAVTKFLIDFRPTDWLALIGSPSDGAEALDVTLLDTDLSTVTSQSDRVIKVNAPATRLQHIELESGHHGARTPRNLLVYNVLLRAKHSLPVSSTVVLLRPEADSPALTGALQYDDAEGDIEIFFKYGVVRVWQLDVERLLTGGIGTLPLAPLASPASKALPDVIRRMQIRIDAETDLSANRELWTATNILMGLRFPQAETDELLRGVRQMRESVTYQAILREGEMKGRLEGRAEEAHSVILRLGRIRLGDPLPATKAAIEAITAIEVLEHLEERLLAVETWDDLLAEA